MIPPFPIPHTPQNPQNCKFSPANILKYRELFINVSFPCMDAVLRRGWLERHFEYSSKKTALVDHRLDAFLAVDGGKASLLTRGV